MSGKRLLPSAEVMKERIARDAAESRQQFSETNTNWRGLVHWIPYMDTLATEIGCLPRRNLLFSDPMLWMKLLIGPMSAFHYRLHGPWAKPEIARAILMKLPIGMRVTDLPFYLGIHFTIALLSWPVFLLAEMSKLVFGVIKRIMGICIVKVVNDRKGQRGETPGREILISANTSITACTPKEAKRRHFSTKLATDRDYLDKRTPEIDGRHC